MTSNLQNLGADFLLTSVVQNIGLEINLLSRNKPIFIFFIGILIRITEMGVVSVNIVAKRFGNILWDSMHGQMCSVQ